MDSDSESEADWARSSESYMDGYVPNRYPTFGTVLYPNNVNIDGRQRHRQRSQGAVRERERKRVTCGGYEPSGERAVLDPAQSSRLKKS